MEHGRHGEPCEIPADGDTIRTAGARGGARQHPLSDEKTSKIDERLIGTWHVEGDPADWQVKKSPQTANALELTMPDPGAPKSLLFTTRTKTRSFFGIFEERIVEEKGPVITAAPQALVRYLEAHADQCYPAKTKATLTWKRRK